MTFKVLKSWKGRSKKELTIESMDYCSCPSKSFNFETGNQFLVITNLQGDDNKIIFDPCPLYSYQVDENPEEAKKTMKRLDNFWFRTWSTIYPF